MSITFKIWVINPWSIKKKIRKWIADWTWNFTDMQIFLVPLIAPRWLYSINWQNFNLSTCFRTWDLWVGSPIYSIHRVPCLLPKCEPITYPTITCLMLYKSCQWKSVNQRQSNIFNILCFSPQQQILNENCTV